VALGQVFLAALHFSPVSIIPSLLLTHFPLPSALTSRTNEPSLGTHQKAVFLRKSEGVG